MLFLRVFKIEIGNTPLALALSFFISLSAYVAGGVIFLFLIRGNSLLVLKNFSLMYVICSYLIIGYFLFKRVREKKVLLTPFIKKYGVVFFSLLFVVFIFSLGAYKTVLWDEWLHRPVIKFFLTNGEFPFKNPYNRYDNFTYSYHYGLYLLVSAIQLLTNIGISESLDVMKISFVIASFMLFFGLLYKWSSQKYYSLTGTVLLLLSGSSFFFNDGFSVNYWFMWGEKVEAMNYPLLNSLLGITWVNLPATLAFIIIIEKLFYYKSSYYFNIISSLIFLLVGYFLISELFSVLLILCLFALAIKNILNRNISLARAVLLSVIFVVVITMGIYISGGVMAGAFQDFGGLLSIRNLHSWGYPSWIYPSTYYSIISPASNWLFYLKNYLLEFVIAAILVYGIYKKKITILQQPLMLACLLITFIVPFIFTTRYGDINLYKLTFLGILLMHMLFFYYYSINFKTPVYYLVVVLFVIGSLPLIFSNYHIRHGDTAIGKLFRCVQNDLCYNRSVVYVLNKLENKPGIKYVLTAPVNALEVVDIVNAYAINYSGILNPDYLGREKIQYIFLTPSLRLMLTKQQLNYLDSLEIIAEKDEFKILNAGFKD